MRENRFRTALEQGRPTVGLWSLLSDPVAVEIEASSGFDWLLFDLEHAPGDPASVLRGLQVAAAYETAVIVRPPSGDPTVIKRILDVGAQNLLVPMVETAEQAAALASAVAFPPRGTRGVSAQTRAGDWGRDPGYLLSARAATCLIVQIESVKAVENVEEILAVDGVDAVFLGTADLAADMGLLGQSGHPDVVAAGDRVLAASLAADVPIGCLVRNPDAALRALGQGFAFVGVGTDTALLATALNELRSRFPSQGGER